MTNGRNFECYSEDPVLTAELAVAYVEGLQAQGVAATPKHFAGNESEIERTTMSSEIDERTLREIYLPPFEAAVKRAGDLGADDLLQPAERHLHLRAPLAARPRCCAATGASTALVMSDWFGSHSTAPTVNAGLDLEMPGPAARPRREARRRRRGGRGRRRDRARARARTSCG